MLTALGCASPALAQTQTPPPLPPAPTAAEAPKDVRPATTTFLGDTGLWNVPTAEILPARKWSGSAYRLNFDDNQGFTDVSNWPITFGYGIRDRAEIFGSFIAVNRIDRDIRPLFLSSSVFTKVGGVVPQNPLARAGWSGNNVGDFWVGAKVNLASDWQQKPIAFAIRGMVKLPTGDTASGAGAGTADFALDAVVSKELNRRAEVSGYGGFIVRGKPDEVDTTNGFRWGVGAGFPSRQALRLTVELDGEAYSKSSLATKTQLLAEDGSFLPTGFSSSVKSPVNLDLGLTWQHRSGFFAGAGWTWR
ncbi:MAG TPA: hypothetical protein VEL79_14580, partial [Vicinamibacterales bacterium]|nr:hypothetical protein [Vicinamibacterales bacterium]